MLLTIKYTLHSNRNPKEVDRINHQQHRPTSRVGNGHTGIAKINTDHIQSPLRLNIGGTTPLAGWKILNIQPADGVDYIGDCTDLSQFKDSSFCEVYASHVFEHLSYVNKLLETLKGVHRILKPGGILRSSVPDFEVLCKIFLYPSLTADQRFYIMNIIFGGQQNQHDYHKVGLTWEFMSSYLKQAGFTSIKRVSEFGIFENDCSSIKIGGQLISLNIEAIK